jgi:uncharacterized RDD family membrane protein YckC
MAETNETMLEIPAEDLDLGTPAQLEYAGFWSRVAALIVDNAIVMIFGLAILIAASSAGAGAVVIANVVYILVSILYWPLMECSERQATIGKQLLGIQVTDADGARLNFVRALLRNLAKIISSLPFGLGFLLAAFTPRKQALHDMITKCLVVRAGPSNFMKAVVAAVVALAITIGGGYYYFSEVYLPQMAEDMGRQMEKSMKQAQKSAPAKPAPAPAPAAQQPAPAATAPAGPKPMTPQEIAEFEKKVAESKPESAKVAVVAEPVPASKPAPGQKPAAPAPAKPAAAPAAAPKPEPKPAAAPKPEPKPAAAPKPEPKVAMAPVEKPKPKPAPAPAAEAPAPSVAEPPAPSPAAEPRASAPPAAAQAAPAPVTPAASGRVVSPRFNDVMTAVMYRDTATVAQLLELGWWVDRPDSNGVTPLMAAAWLGDPESTRLLLKGGADPNRSSTAGTVLDYASRGGNAEVIQLVRASGGR